MNFYKRHIGDYLKDTAHLTLLEHGVYSRLLDVYYTRESGIPDAQAARLIGARGKEETAALKVVLDEFFELVDGTWVQDRCEREIHAAGPVSDEGDGAPSKSGKARRQQEYRERRAALFEALRERGITMPFKATMNELQDALLNVTKQSRVMPTVTDDADSVTERVTDDGHNVTATNSHKPESSSQTPDLNTGSVVAFGTSPRESDDEKPVVPKDEGEWQRYFREEHGVELSASSVHDRRKAWPIFTAWVKAKVSTQQVDAAISKARLEARETIAFLPGYADRVLASMSRPPQAARLNPEEQRRVTSKRHEDAWLAQGEETDPNVIDMEVNHAGR